MTDQQNVLMAGNKSRHGAEEWTKCTAIAGTHNGGGAGSRGTGCSRFTRPVAGYKKIWVGVNIICIAIGNVEELPVIIIRRIVGSDPKAKCAPLKTGKPIPKGIDIR